MVLKLLKYVKKFWFYRILCRTMHKAGAYNSYATVPVLNQACVYFKDTSLPASIQCNKLSRAASVGTDVTQVSQTVVP